MKIDKWDYIKLKNLPYTQNYQQKGNVWNRRKYLQTTYLISG